MASHGAMGTNVETSIQKAYTIGGVPIIFPYRAYPSQITMMDRIIKCLNKKNNCLLESPTGSGKSLALLCASLAWLKKTSKEFREMEEILYRNLNVYGVAIADDNQSYDGEQSKIFSEDNKFNTYSKNEISDSKTNILQKSDDTKSCNSKAVSSEFPFPKDSTEVSKANDKNTPLFSDKLENNVYENYFSKKAGIIYIDDDDDDMEDFQPIKKVKRSSNAQEFETSFSSQNDSLTTAASPEQFKNNTALKLEEKCNNSACETIQTSKIKTEYQMDSTLPAKIPKIYFGTRTHKQIEQIIRELKKTPYKDVKMTILSGRERTCIHPKVSKSRNKSEDCNDLIHREEGPGCKFYINTCRSSLIHNIAPQSAYDLEDFVSICKRKKLCPYYGCRELLTTAEIVFCPYSYLIDPLIRTAMNIDLKGNIVIMDEAHNIEDSGREAVSTQISVSQLQDAIADLLNAGQLKHDGSEPYMHIAKVLENLKRWLENSQDLKDYVSFDSSSRVWSGDDMIAILDYVGLGPDTFPKFQNMYSIIIREEKDNEKEKKPELIKLSGKTNMCLENLTLPLKYIYKDKLLFAPDYRCVVMKSKVYSDDSSVVPFSQNSKRKSLSNTFHITLNFWCLNPAVAFSDLKNIHSLVVASGTLAPLTSFQSELGIPFHLTLEANHVVNSKNMWIGTIGKGPSNNLLNATFHNAATFAFQDDVGNLVLEVCSVIPHGVLCFLPSYGMLDKLVNRWQLTGLWDKLLNKKVVLREPRANENFQQVIAEFYDAVKDSETSGCLEVNGALFLAVCRGKVSEGLDFADNNARAVITIGIPFPNIKDAQVDLKKKYNDLYSFKRQLVRGSAWYEMQAFRALNQALGRCIRHRNDFGALIIVDERFQKYDHYVSALSKWIKKEIKHYPTFYDALCSLSNFASDMGLKNTTDEIEVSLHN